MTNPRERFVTGVMSPLIWRLGAAIIALCVAGRVHGAELDLRLKAFGDLGFLPATDIERSEIGARSGNASIDMRAMFSGGADELTYTVHHTTVLLMGDAVSGLESAVAFDQAALDDDSRAIDRKSTRLNSSHSQQSRMPSSA